MKRHLNLMAMLLCLAMILSMLGCGASGESAITSSNVSVSVEEHTETPAEEPDTAQEAVVMEEADPESAMESNVEEIEPVEEMVLSGNLVPRDTSKGQLLSSDASVEEIVANISPQLPENLPLTEDGAEITYLTEFNEKMYETIPGGYADCYPFQVAEALTGVHITFREISSGAWTEQFSLIVASGDYPDLVASKTEYSGGDDKGVEDEFILALNDYLEEYCPNYYSFLQQGDNMTQVMTDTGNVAAFYIINTDDGCPSGTGNAFIRTDYLEKVGMEKPATYDEWYAVLKAFQTELGISEPIMWPATLVGTDQGMVSGYGVAGNASIDHRGTNIPYYVVDGEVRYGLIQDEYHEFMEMCRTWYDEGLISSEFLTKNENSREADFITTITEGHSGIFFIDNQEVESLIDMGKEIDPDFAVEAISSPVKSEGDINHFATINSLNKAYWVTTNVENLELVLSWCDFWYTQVGSDLCEWGLEGVTFQYDENDQRYLTEFGDSIFISSTNRDLRTVYSLNNVGYVSLQVNSTDSEFVKACNEIRSVNTDNAYTLPAISLTAEESEEHSGIYSDIATYVNECLPKFLTGDKSMDEWDEFIANIYSMNIERCLEIYQAAYDRYCARTGAQ